jgi:hypothetical protein
MGGELCQHLRQAYDCSAEIESRAKAHACTRDAIRDAIAVNIHETTLHRRGFAQGIHVAGPQTNTARIIFQYINWRGKGFRCSQATWA